MKKNSPESRWDGFSGEFFFCSYLRSYMQDDMPSVVAIAVKMLMVN